MAPRTICQEAHERLLAAEEVYGDLLDLSHRVAEKVSQRTGIYFPTEAVLWVAIEVALERHRRRPQEVEHLRDAVGHLDLLAQLHALKSTDSATRPTRRVP